MPVTIGLIGWALALLLPRYGGRIVIEAQVAASDWLFVRHDGLRLGARPASDDIVLVLFDRKTATELGYVHSYEDDAKLYRGLMEAGAKVVFDTRVAAAAEEKVFEEIRPLLEEMLTLNDNGRLMRDIWLSSALQEKSDGRYEQLCAQNVVSSHPHALADAETRIYPLAYFTAAGPAESAPLAITRRVRDLPRATATEVGDELRRSGVMSVWHTHAPEMVPKTEVARSPYRLGDEPIDWYEFLSTTPLVPPVGFWVSYDPLAAGYQRHSFVDVLKNASAEEFKDKIVLIGFDAEIDPTSDTYALPSVAGKGSAVELVASATQTLLDGRNMTLLPAGLSAAVAGALIMASSLVAGLMKPVRSAAAFLGLLLLYYAFAVAAYRAGTYPDCAAIPAVALATAVAAGIGNAWFGLRVRRRIVDLFGRYVPRAVVNQLMLQPDLETLTLGGTVRDVTVLFADIRGFTTYAQDMPPEEVVRELNGLLEIMVDCTFINGGTLDKFIGDAILVLFNAPLDQPDHTERAVRTALMIQQRLPAHASKLHVGVGVHRGDAVVGNVGTPERMEYTAIGSTVNIASRLCDSAKPGEVVVSQRVLKSLGEGVKFESLGAIQVKGISTPLEAARVFE